MKRLIVVFVVAASACSSDDSPTAPPGPPPVTYTLTGTVTESEPTTHVALPGTVIRVLNGSAAGLTTTTDSKGNFSLTGVSGRFDLEAAKNGYLTKTEQIISQPTTIAFRLMPPPQLLTSTFNESISGGDRLCGMTTPCKFYAFDVHNAGTIDATLTWSNPDTWLGLSLQGCVGYECAESWSSRSRVDLAQRLTVNTAGGRITTSPSNI